MTQTNLSPASSELMPDAFHYKISDHDFSSLMKMFCAELLDKPQVLMNDSLQRKTALDLARLNLVITDNQFIQCVFDRFEEEAVSLLSVDEAPDMECVNGADLKSPAVWFEQQLLNANVTPDLIKYLKTHFNQESLLLADSLYPLCRAFYLSAFPDEYSSLTGRRLSYCRQLKLIDSDRVELVLHCYTKQQNRIQPIAETTIEVRIDELGNIQKNVTSHCLHDVADTVFSHDLVREKLFKHLVGQQELTLGSNLKALLQMINLLQTHATVCRERISSGYTTQADEKKCHALQDVVNCATNVLVKVTINAPVFAQKRACNQLKNCLLRNTVPLNAHRNLLLKLWNLLVDVMKSRTIATVPSVDNNQAGFFSLRKAKTSSMDLAESCMRVCNVRQS
jgi:hypothetical protein